MSPPGIALAELLVRAVPIGVAARKLVRYGNAVGAEAGLAGSRVGMVTALPGPMTGLSAVALDDFAYPRGTLLAHASTVHAVRAFAAILLTSIVVAALPCRAPRERKGAITFANLALAGIFLVDASVPFSGAA